jgi:hypothetical protein
VHVTGDVDVMLTVRQDGGVVSAVAVSGPGVLRAAALSSALQTQYGCGKCSEATNIFPVVYTFQIDDDPSCVPAFSNAKVDNRVQAANKSAGASYHITITAELICIMDPASDFRKIRLYLWRCGS